MLMTDDGRICALYQGDNIESMRSMPDAFLDSIVTDPPYGLSKQPDMREVLTHWLNGDDYNHRSKGFMGKSWDSFVPGPKTWEEAYRVLKPGAYMLVFAGSRTVDLMSMSIRLAGFEVVDMLHWLYGTGFPKSMDISKAIDKHGGSAVGWFGPWFKEYRKNKGISQSQVSALFPSQTVGKTGCVSNWELGLNMPTPEQFNLICKTFDLPFDSLESAEREVIGQKLNSKLAVAPGQNNDRSNINVDITTPKTDAAKQWDGWGTALKPCHEPIILARKPLDGTYANNVLTHGCGGLNIDGCRVPSNDDTRRVNRAKNSYMSGSIGEVQDLSDTYCTGSEKGRWPGNVLHDGVLPPPMDKYFYCAKASKADRNFGLMGDDIAPTELVNRAEGSAGIENPRAGAGRTSGSKNPHPTVKPIDLMRWCVRLITPPGGMTGDPFMGSGSTGVAAALEGVSFTGCELDETYFNIAQERTNYAYTIPRN